MEWVVDTNLLASGGNDKKLFLWEIPSGKQVSTINCPDQINKIHSLDKNGNMLVLFPPASFSTVRINPLEQSPESNAIIFPFSIASQATPILFPKNDKLVCCLKPDEMAIIDLTTRSLIMKFQCPSDRWGVCNCSPDGNMIVGTDRDKIYLFNMYQGKKLFEMDHSSSYGSDYSMGIPNIAWSEDSSCFFSALSSEGLVKVWDSKTGENIAAWDGGGASEFGEFEVCDVAAHPTEKCIALGDNKGNVFVLSV